MDGKLFSIPQKLLDDFEIFKDPLIGLTDQRDCDLLAENETLYTVSFGQSTAKCMTDHKEKSCIINNSNILRKMHTNIQSEYLE